VDMNSQPWSGRPVVQVRPVRKANQHISGFQEAESRRTYYKNRGIAQKAIAEKLNFGSCNVREVIAGLVYGLTLNLLMTTIFAPPSNTSKWQKGFNSAFKGLNMNIGLK